MLRRLKMRMRNLIQSQNLPKKFRKKMKKKLKVWNKTLRTLRKKKDQADAKA